MSSGNFFDNGVEFHPSFLGILIGCGALSVFSLLYFNRVFASIVSWGIRTYTWHRHGVYIDIQALQISLLAGRIFFTGFRYHGNNETILVQNGHITWAYWLRRVREVNVGNGKGVDQGADTAAGDASSKLPCRIKVSLRGLEWFVYNRSPAYDSVLSGLTASAGAAPGPEADPGQRGPGTNAPDTPAQLRRRRSGRQEAARSSSPARIPVATEKSRTARRNGSSSHVGASDSNPDLPTFDHDRDQDESASDGNADLPLLLQLLPIHLACDRAALVMGNENTKAILIVKASSLSGEIDASDTETIDPYRQYFRFNFKNPVIEMKENMDFKEEQADRAVRDKQAAQGSLFTPKRSFLHWQRRRLREGLRNMVPFWSRSVESLSPSARAIGTAASQVPGAGQWQGLSRYLSDDAEDQKSRWASSEYAAVPTLLDSPEASLTIFWDVPAKVGPVLASSQEKIPGRAPNVNGTEAPAWAISLSINGGSINYGPWADRHRADLQRTFVPSLCKDAVPASPLAPGAFRVPTEFKFYVEITDETTVRVPVREASKNWRWRGKEPSSKKPHSGDARKARRSKKSDGPADLHQRPFGWLDLKVPANATVSYSMDMVAGGSGYTNALDVDLPTTEISSSINHEVLLKSRRQRISCDLSTPLGWNALRQWYFNIKSEDLELFILRDHVFLLIDLVDDWTSGPPPDYLVFTPFKYHLNLQLQSVRLFLNLNDANIVNNPTDMEDNTYLILSSPLLKSETCIPVDNYRASENAIPFDIRADTAAVDFHVPPWNTQAQFVASSEVGRLENLAIDGAYHYHTATSPANTDTLVLNISGQSPTARLHGFTIRYLLMLKDNYFGDHIHFRTLEEYQDMLRLRESDPDAELANQPPPKKSNDLDVVLSVRADDPKVLFPAGLYSSQRHVQMDAASLCVDLRFTNYYMDMDLAVAPLNLSLGNAESGTETPMSATSSTQMFIDGLHVYGHRLFGLPPVEPTYMCNWDLSLGALTGECTTEFLMALASAGKAFAFTFDDDENALIPFSSILVYDVTFLRVFVQSVRLWLHVEDAAFLFSTGTIDVNYNDWARSHYSRRASINIPDIKLSCLNAELATRHKARSQHAVEADALLATSLRVAVIGRKAQFSKERKLQQDLVRKHDQRTQRTPFLVVPGLAEDDSIPDLVDPPAQCVPPVPVPVGPEDAGVDRASLRSKASSRQSRRLRHKSSFLSLASSAPSNVLRPFQSRRSSGKGKLPDRLNYQYPLRSRFDEKGNASMHGRELSPSTRHSAFYSMPGDSGEQHEATHNTVAFSSQYFAPYFPLENIRPSHAEAMAQSIELDDEDSTGFGSVTFDLEDIDPNLFSEEFAYSSIQLELPSGLTAFCNPTSLRYVASLVSSLQHTELECVLDSMQMDSMKEIFDAQKDQTMKGRVNDLLVSLPHANFRVLNFTEGDSLDQADDEQDQYDVTLTGLSFTSRSHTAWQDAFKPQSRSARQSFHLRLSSAEVAATERLHGMHSTQAAALVRLESVLASMGTKDVTYCDAEIGGIHCSTSSGKVDYLASLVHRAGVLGSEIERLFSEASSQEKMAAQTLVHRLVSAGGRTPDPSFFIRPSAVLRSARQHLRTFDSWKLAMRLRQLWAMLAPDAREQIKLDCLARPSAATAALRREVITAFERWRSWDLGNLEESVLINLVFGPADVTTPKDSSQDRPTLAVVRVKQIQLALNPGPKQNGITLVNLVTRLENKPATSGEQGDGLGGVVNGPLTTLKVSCEGAAVSLNWELCELAESLLRLTKTMQSRASVRVPDKPQQSSGPAARKSPSQGSLHCVLSLGHGSLVLEAINLYSASFSTGAKASVLVKKGADNSMDTNMILSCESVTSSLRSHHQKLVKLIMEKPSVFVSYQLRASQTTDCHTIKIAASNVDLSLAVKQDPVTLAEVLDLLVRDEFAQLYKLKTQLPLSPRSTSSSKKISDRLSAFRVNVAMFMDRYILSVPLLPSVIYTVHGTVSRAAMAANFGREIIFDFDIKENSHDVQVRVNNVSRSISLLQIPPTNGRIRSHMESGEHSISVFASVELVQLDASAVYSLVSALNRPEISNVVNELQQQVKTIQEHLGEITGEAPKTDAKATEKSTALVYSAHLTFAGLEVFGNSPLKSEAGPLAHISFALGSVHLGISNRVEQHGPILTYPEVNVDLRRIAFEIQRGSPEAMKSCGNVAFGALISASSCTGEDGKDRRFFHVKSDAFEVNLSPDTISTVVDVLGYMGNKIKDLDTSRELEYLRKLRQTRPRIAINDAEAEDESDILDTFLSSITYSCEICNIQLAWLVNEAVEEPARGKEDLVLSLQRIELGTRTRNSARLTIEALQLQMVSFSHDKLTRSPNSALLPEVIFNVAYVSTADARRLAFQAVGKSLDVRLTSGFIIPAAHLNDSISLSYKNIQQASQKWNPAVSRSQQPATATPSEEAPRKNILGGKRLESLLVDADFAGAVVHLTGQKPPADLVSATKPARPTSSGRQGHPGPDEAMSSTTLKSPGLALKVEFRDDGKDDPSLHAEVKIDASNNILYPSLVPLVMDISNSVKEVVSSRDGKDHKAAVQAREVVAKVKLPEEDSILTADPAAVLGRMKLNLGLRICKQEFSLSCQPIARVAATASFEDVYFTVNTVRSMEQGNFFAISGVFTNLQASVQHVYSRESTGSFKVRSIVLSFLNSKHLSGTSGVSAILKVSPMEVWVNAKQLQDFMLFGEIWLPHRAADPSAAPAAKPGTETPQGHLVQRYQQVAATAAFPWTASISISALKIVVDLGQALGKSTFSINDFWISSKKTSDWEQNLCLGFSMIGIESVGRMSGFVALEKFRLRTSIEWPDRERALNETPLIQASVGFSQFRVKAAFDYQAFLVADITSLGFLMYNVRRRREGSGDRLVAILDGEAVQVFGTATSASQGVAMYRAFQRLMQERKANFETSLKEIERYMQRRSVAAPAGVMHRLGIPKPVPGDDGAIKSPISLDTDVVITLRALNLGVFPSTFSDHQVFKMEALDAQARFAASVQDDGRVHSMLGLTLGQLRIGLAGVRAGAGPAKTLSELSVEDVVQSATGSRGGTILKVPQVEAVMQTWQRPESKRIDYIFKSAFEGKVEVGWNYSRISYIRGMWANHVKTLAQTWGRDLPNVTAIRVTGALPPEIASSSSTTSSSTAAAITPSSSSQTTNKITAEVKVPQSRYEYVALEPPVIETPQLRDMGEATPPLEWIGLNRDRLPNLTHQIAIVALLELAGEVEDAYGRILGSS
ncbi:hypothetical protein N658DRAFT_420724 [Parathielavia hyrcaniae]|uniref:Protein CSF1 n=1 Tax=Parathielavia hyrcaniae TaxID=113614 RepID=A0AAN6Q627_9PEZI|nr:hypothetical protein N658DRAFT_420724 [Parathielavia hyrcaniae]